MFDFFKKTKKGEVELNCPRCNIVMKKLNKDEVIIDICPKCNGMWLDDKEIEKLANLGKVKKNGKKQKN